MEGEGTGTVFVEIGLCWLGLRPFGGFSLASVDSRLRLIEVPAVFCAASASASIMMLALGELDVVAEATAVVVSLVGLVVLLVLLVVAAAAALGLTLLSLLLLLSCIGVETPFGSAMAGEAIFSR